MSIGPGVRIGPYEVLSALGAGGMGEVYRARDTKLGRDVAIKVLPDHFSADPDRLARFQREAQVLAQLTHPNIAGIYGLEESPSSGSGQTAVKALVLEFVDGETLAERLTRRLEVDEALAIGRQIAEALETAHEHGIIHRDLKPANIKVRSDGTVKVLDFGLAKALAPETSTSGQLMNSPTLSVLATHAGIIMGTAAYMAPEQAKGKAVDRRADIWALEGVAASAQNGAAQYAVSATGTLVYLPGKSLDASGPIHWMGKDGKAIPLRSAPSDWSNPRFSPDGSRLAIDIFDGKQVDVWIYEWARDTLTRLTTDPSNDSLPVWSPDGRRIVLASTRGDKGTTNLYWQRADGSDQAQRLTDSKNAQLPGTWHPTGKYLVFQEVAPTTGQDVQILPMEGDEASGWKPGKPTVFLSTPFNESAPVFSPDGKWIAYQSNESGRTGTDVYVRPFPGSGGKWLISTAGGASPTWSAVRRELLYRTPINETFEQTIANQIMVASYTVEGDTFKADRPQLWSKQPIQPRPRQRPFDLHPDGERFAVSIPRETENVGKQDKVVFIFNFFDELRRIAP